MIKLGYLAKQVATTPAGFAAPDVVDIYSVSACISADFADYICYWQHNGFWVFDSPALIQRVAALAGTSVDRCRLFYYEAYPLQYLPLQWAWQRFAPEQALPLNVVPAHNPSLEGYDIVSYSAGSSAECSPLSCNQMAKTIRPNAHCLLPALDDAIRLLEDGELENCEPGPYRIIAVHSLQWPLSDAGVDTW